MAGIEKQLSGVTPTEGNRYGSRFELHPVQHAYEAQFARTVAAFALADHRPINVVDFGCGNGDMAIGITHQMYEAGYDEKIIYTGFDIDPKGITAAKDKMSAVHNISLSGLEVVDLRNIDSSNSVLNNLSIYLSNPSLNVLLFCDSLHWLQPSDIKKLLELVYVRAPEGSRVLATACSVWNRTSIGEINNPRQNRHIEEIKKILAKHPNEPLGRTSDQIEYKSAMTHFTDSSLTHVFVDTGFTVTESSYCRNIIFPNGTDNLPENVKLTAYK